MRMRDTVKKTPQAIIAAIYSIGSVFDGLGVGLSVSSILLTSAATGGLIGGFEWSLITGTSSSFSKSLAAVSAPNAASVAYIIPCEANKYVGKSVMYIRSYDVGIPSLL